MSTRWTVSGLVGYLAHQAQVAAGSPGLLVVHDWCGCDDFVQEKARMLAAAGYVALAVDMYGDGRVGEDSNEKTALRNGLINNRRKIQRRMQAALAALKSLEHVDADRVAAIGYCFGGLCVLDLARSGAEIKGVCGFHSTLSAPDFPNEPIKPRVLMMQGHEDPLVPQEQIIEFSREMASAQVDWQVHIYGLAQHSYTKKMRPAQGEGIGYSEAADNRSWRLMHDFLRETLG